MRLTPALLGLAGLLLVGFGPGDGALVFEDDRPLPPLTWDDLAKGTEVQICNVGPEPVRSLRAAPAGFQFKVDGQAADEKRLIQATVPATLEAGVCTAVRLQAIGSRAPDAATYTGLLVVIGTGGGISRREIGIRVGDPSPAPSAAKNAVDTVSLTAVRHPFAWLNTLLGVEPSTIDLPFIGTPAGLKPDSVLGVLANGDNLAYVTIAGLARPGEGGVALLPVRIEQLRAVGTYAGKVDPAPSRDGKTAIALQAKVTHHWLWAALAIGASTALGYWALVWVRRGRVKRLLGERSARLERDYRAIRTAWPVDFTAQYPHFSGYQPPSEDAVKSYLRAFEAALGTYASGNWLFDAGSDAFKKLVQRLELGEGDIQALGRLGASLAPLETEAEQFEQFVNDDFPVTRPPVLLESVADLLKGSPLPVGGAPKVAAEVKEFVGLLQTWRKLAFQVKRYEVWAMRLTQAVNAGLIQISPADQELLQRARARVAEAREEMLDARDTPGLADLGSAEDLRRAYGFLAYLGGRYQLWERPQANKTKQESLADARLLCAGLPLPQVHLGALLAQAAGTVLGPLDLPQVDHAVRVLGDLVLVTVAVIVAIVAGLNQYYFGKTFGTVPDYLVVLFLGSAVGAVFKGVADVATQLRAPIKG